MACSAKPTSSATSRVWSTSPEVSAENSEVGMMPSRKSVVVPALGRLRGTGGGDVLGEVQPRAGVQDVADDQADASATVDMVRK